MSTNLEKVTVSTSLDESRLLPLGFSTVAQRYAVDRLKSSGNSNLFRLHRRKRETGVISLTRRRRFIVQSPRWSDSYENETVLTGSTISGANDRKFRVLYGHAVVVRSPRLRKIRVAVPRPFARDTVVA